jgi:hypothetical protein
MLLMASTSSGGHGSFKGSRSGSSLPTTSAPSRRAGAGAAAGASVSVGVITPAQLSPERRVLHGSSA